MNERDERALQPAPACCRSCMHCTEWRGTTGVRHDCLRGLPMHPDCPWARPRTEPNVKEA